MTLTFTYTALPARVVFAEGSLSQLDAEVARLGCTRPFVIAGAHHALAAKVAAVGLFGDAAMHTPVDVTESALAAVLAANADCLIAIGGGSAIGLAKAIALRTDLPQIVVPTTYAGSEATPILGQTEHGKKTTIRDLRVLPEVIVYDVALSSTLPRSLTVTSGLNAMAHAVEAMYSPDANPVITAFAEQALTALAHALPILVEDLANRDARAEALFGAWTAGTCLGSVGMALHHKLCHTLGGSFELPHSDTHAVVLPYAVAYNATATEAMARIARAIGAVDNSALPFGSAASPGQARLVDNSALPFGSAASPGQARLVDAAGGLRALATKLGAPLSLRELGMPEAGLDRAAELATAAPYPNPRPIEREPIRALLGKAWAGEWPL